MKKQLDFCRIRAVAFAVAVFVSNYMYALQTMYDAKDVMSGISELALINTAAQSDDYPIVFDKSQNYTHSSRRLNGVSLTGSADGDQTIAVASASKVYNIVDEPAFTAKAGERLTPVFQYSGAWMHGFVYLDRGQDGSFEATLGNNAAIPEGSDIMAFSYAETVLNSGNGYNSNGERVTNSNVLNPPSFTLPDDLDNGFYRMRFKVDWASIDPAGRAEDGNGILRNGGAIFDVRMNIHGENVTVNAVSHNGTITAANGSALNGYMHKFGTPLAVKITPAQGYILDGLKIKHGYNLNSDSYIHGVQQYSVVTIPGLLVSDGEYEIPAEYIDGDVEITAVFVECGDDAHAGNYALSFDADASIENTDYSMRGVEFSVSSGRRLTLDIPAEHSTVYANLLQKTLPVKKSSSVNTTVSVAANSLHYYLYVDINNDGKFLATLDENGMPTMSSELLSYTYYNGKNSLGETVDAATAGTVLPQFAISQLVQPGVYRARLKADNNNISPAGSVDIIANGGMVIDFLINIYNEQHPLKLITTNGNIYGANNTALPQNVNPFTAMNVAGTPVAAGYVPGEMVVRHGHNLDGPQYVNGNMQWSEYIPDTHNFTIPADSVNGDVVITIHFVATDDAEYKLVFSDEFNGDNGTQPVSNKWKRCQRYSSTWNRWLSDSEEVIYLEDGDLVARAIPNPDTATDNVPMITGGIKSNGLFGFTYGYVECRLLSNPWVGNFPAFWMMPEDQSAGWPDCGEIDIFETIDTQHRSWHTIHSNWTYDLGYKNNPKSSFDVAVDLSRYHTYALEWNEKQLVWYVDGKEVARYAKSTVQNHLNQGQWPFDKHFHLILNQSVGNGSWAANADVTHTYETRFDWVRVYQKDGMENTNGTVGVSLVEHTTDVDVNVVEGGVSVAVSSPAKVYVCDMAGRVLFSDHVNSYVYVPLSSGVYIVNNHKILVK